METISHAVPPTGPWARIAVVLAQWKQRFARLREDARVRAALKYELQCLDQAGELDGALANIGLSRGAVPVLLRNYPGSARRFWAMTRRLGIAGDRPPTLQAGLASLFGPRRRCLFCSQSGRCERWLREDRADDYRAFCPNANAFERMRQRA